MEEIAETTESYDRQLKAALAGLEHVCREGEQRAARRAGAMITESPEWRQRVLQVVEDCPAMETAAKVAERFCKRFRRDIRKASDGSIRTLLVFVGENGCGKTHLAKRILRYAGGVAVDAWAEGFWPEPPRKAYADWASYVASERDGIEQDLAEAHLTIVDDVGAEVDRFKSGEHIEKLRRLLSAREGRWTVLTTNIRSDEWAKHWDKRVADRLTRSAKVVDLSKLKPWAIRRKDALKTSAPTPPQND